MAHRLHIGPLPEGGGLFVYLDSAYLPGMSHRMEVNRAAGPNYIVIDNGEALGPYPSLTVAFGEVLVRGGRVHLEWFRTVIGGKANPKDFSARFEDEDAGRIYFESGGMAGEVWKAFPGGHNRKTGRMGGGTQICDTKDEAVEFIERKFTELMAGVEPKPAANAYLKAKGQ